MADHIEIAKHKYNSLLELCYGIEDVLTWKDVYPQYSKISLKDLLEIELYRYILYLGSHCKKITEEVSDFMAEYFGWAFTSSEFKKKIMQLELDKVNYDCIKFGIHDSLNILVSADNLMAAQSIDSYYTQWLYETYHNYGTIFLVMMKENVDGNGFKALFDHDHYMKLQIEIILKNHDWLSNVENSENIDLQKTRDEIEDSKPRLKEGQAIVTNVYFDDLWG